jgi:hypothetical protein
MKRGVFEDVLYLFVSTKIEDEYRGKKSKGWLI